VQALRQTASEEQKARTFKQLEEPRRGGTKPASEWKFDKNRGKSLYRKGGIKK